MSSTPQPAPEATNRQLLEEIRDNTRTLSIKLFGSSDAEIESDAARFPKAERGIKHAHQRIDKIEKRIVWVSGFAAAFSLFITRLAELYLKSRGH